jgi:cytosine/adenosine deaminase-related metal-dependent hydrolase
MLCGFCGLLMTVTQMSTTLITSSPRARFLHIQSTLSSSEHAAIVARGAKVSHCPVSNSALGSGLCHVREPFGSGIVVGLRMDISSGYSPGILEAARHVCLISRLVASQIEKVRREISS